MARRKRESTEILNRNEVSRREFLQIAGAAAGLTLLPRLAAANARVIRAEPALATLAGEAYPQTAVWTYGGTVPGTELRFKQGERLRVELQNLLPEDTTVHWHGVRLPNAMDGVPHVTQAPIAAKGGRFLYEFDLRDAGTYWYHPHLGSPGQVGRGLYAPLRSEEHTSELQSPCNLVCRLLLEKKKRPADFDFNLRSRTVGVSTRRSEVCLRTRLDSARCHQPTLQVSSQSECYRCSTCITSVS